MFRYIKPPVFYNVQVKKVLAKRVVTFTFYLVAPYSVYILLVFQAAPHNMIFLGRWGKCIYSWEEEYFSIEVTHNFCFALMNKNSTQKVCLLILPSFLNIVFRLVFEHRIDWCSVSCLLYPLMVCFQIIAPQYYNYDVNVNPIIWLLFFPVE